MTGGQGNTHGCRLGALPSVRTVTIGSEPRRRRHEKVAGPRGRHPTRLAGETTTLHNLPRSQFSQSLCLVALAAKQTWNIIHDSTLP